MGSAFSRTVPQEEAVTQIHPSEDVKATSPGTQTHYNSGANLDQKGCGGLDGQVCQHEGIDMPILQVAEVPDTPDPGATEAAQEAGAIVAITNQTTSSRPKRKSALSTPTTTSKQRKRRKSNQYWTYVGLQYGSSSDSQNDARPGCVQCPDNRWYPRELIMKEGDVPVSVYTSEEYDNDKEYEVEAILDERRRGTTIQYRVKWKGYELDPEEFVKREALEECEALDRWEAAQAVAKSTSHHLTTES